MNSYSDNELIIRFLDGDSNAFNLLVVKWQAPIYRLAYRYLRDEHYAKDICQNTFIKVYKNIKKIKNINSFPVWIYRIAVNLSKNELSRRKKKRCFSFEQVNDETGSQLNCIHNSKAEVEEEIITKDIGTILKKAIDKLSEEQKTVLILKEYQGLKFIEIAEILEISIDTAKSRMYYALKNMRNILKKSNLDKEV